MNELTIPTIVLMTVSSLLALFATQIPYEIATALFIGVITTTCAFLLFFIIDHDFGRAFKQLVVQNNVKKRA